jgi:beta-xylosidase
VIQEYDPDAKVLTGPIARYFRALPRIVEGSHLYKFNGWYYLMTAEGGTGFNHAVTTARSVPCSAPTKSSRKIPVISSRYDARAPIQRSGHGSLWRPRTDAGTSRICAAARSPTRALHSSARDRDPGSSLDGGGLAAYGERHQAHPVEVDAPGLPAHPA